MANLRITLDVDGLAPALRVVGGAADRAANLRPALERIGSDLLRASRGQFASGRGWRKLAAATRERKARQGLDPRRMVATGALARSLTRTGAARVTSTELAFGTTVFYARFHHGTRTMPRRKPVPVRAVQRRSWREQITDHITAGASG